MDSPQKLIERIRFDVERLKSDAESEKGTRKRRNEGIDSAIADFTLRIDRIENTMKEQKISRRDMNKMWVAIIIIVVEQILIHTLK